ncbi:aminotransferase DegT [Candidatus Beckwithbacteria bacterium CG10_big_fil_rev_8_21_14_0_10_34_10]|uniref:Aminotransferase DegT n=1 Tax=Candidatus Beckwithbacteria bacterium CG10_big_fil_rev_8_21_14_0_10_34_10 TaxID=1974495 RepID=A0A2H0WA01_9BACT|nr:MAG: aminotransferase DegT [Candidatus Beckwithbacteria bacterium CG10_big_fil_rev_8_21_14_0_10_34_10]
MIPVNQPLISKNAKKYVLDCLKTGWVSSAGKYIDRFENKFAKFCQSKYGVSCTSGTAALHLALETLGICREDEVIIPSLTMMATALAVYYTGAKPILIDSESDTYNINPSLIEKKITSKTKAIIPVHLYGHPVNMDPILKIARKYKLKVVEDAAEIHGGKYKGKMAGSLGDIGCFSFYANKIITTGEGGMIVTNSKKIFEKAKRLKNLSHSPKKRFLHNEIGFNYRMTNLQAALGLAQLEEVKKYLRIKRWLAGKYSQGLKNINGLILPQEKNYAFNVYWMYTVLVNEKEFGLKTDELRRKLLKLGVDTRSFFIPIHKQPVFRKLGWYKNEKYPVAEKLTKTGFYLPSGLAISESQLNQVIKAFKTIKN